MYRVLVTLILSSLLGVTLTGCEQGINPTRLDNPDRLPEQYGIVAVQVVSNARRLTPVLETWTSVIAIDLDNSEETYELKANMNGLLGSRVFIGALPEGRYALLNLHSYRNLGDYSAWMNAPVPRTLGAFRVEIDRITSLGTIVYQPLETRVPYDEREGLYVISRFRDEEDLTRFIREAHGEAYARIENKLQIGWESNDFEDSWNELAAKHRKFSVPMDYHWLGDGQVAMTGKLGQIFFRHADGGWERVDTGYSQQISELIKAGGYYYAAGERGLVLRSKRLRGPWKKMSGPGSKEAINWMDLGVNGDIYALTKRGMDKSFYRVSGDFGDWARIREFEYKGNFFVKDSNSVYAVSGKDGEIILFANKKRHVYDGGFDAGRQKKVDEFLQMALQPNGILVARTGHWFSGSGHPKYSMDLGSSWHIVPEVRSAEQSNLSTRSIPIVLDMQSMLEVTHRGRRAEGVSVMRFEKAARVRVASSSSKVEQWGERISESCTDLIPELSTRERIFRGCDDGRLFASDDLGMSWSLDYQTGMRPEDVADEMEGEGLVHIRTGRTGWAAVE